MLLVQIQILAFAQVVNLRPFGYTVDMQVQTVDTVCSVDGQVRVFVHFLFVVGDMTFVFRTVQPVVRQIHLADGCVFGVEESRINDQYQLATVVAAAFCRSLHVVGAGIVDGGIVVGRPLIRELFVGDLDRIDMERSRIEMQMYHHDAVAVVDGMEIGHYRGIGGVLLPVVADDRIVSAGVHMLHDGVSVARPNLELQHIDGIRIRFADLRWDRIDVRTGCRIDTAAPFVVITFADRGYSSERI